MKMKTMNDKWRPVVLFVAFVMMGLGGASAQVLKIHNYHAKETDKADLNQVYINKKALKLTAIDSSCFVDGYVVKGKDTIECDIYLSKHKIPDDIFLYTIVRGGDGEVSIYTAKDIDAYGYKGVSMKAQESNGARFFIREIISGQVTLYQREGIPSDEEMTYYLQRRGDNKLVWCAPNKKSFMYIQERYKGGGMVSQYSGQNEDQMRAAFAEYFKDCESLRNKLLAKFYSVSDLETVVKEYNGCGR